MAGQADVGRQALWRLLAALILCLLGLAVPVSGADHPLPGPDHMAVAGPDHHSPQLPACHHDSHHGGAVALLSGSRSGPESLSGDATDGPVSGFPEPLVVSAADIRPDTVSTHSRCVPPVYLLTQRLRL
ncbi:MAG: hypothetical protein JJT90_16675 [Ectothiorhodospiraceae bacterium]|nr:hypothetical protein [Ectothiorhodospiraceae bacterium]